MKYDPNLTKPKRIPMGLASKKLSPETLDGLVEFFASPHMKASDDASFLHPAVTFSQWIRECLDEKKPIAEKCVQRFLWHMKEGTFPDFHEDNWTKVVGLMQFDQNDSAASLSREQEVAVLKLKMTLSRLGQKSRGVSRWIDYGKSLTGDKLLYERLGQFVLENPERINDICWIIRERNFTNLKDIVPLLGAMGTTPLNSGAL